MLIEQEEDTNGKKMPFPIVF
eukprot:SAG31_NODE_25092_length_468_cov_0.775068_1_plen_20_part_10